MKTQTTIMVLGIIAAASLISVAAFSENSTQYSVVSTLAPSALQIVGHLELVAFDPDGNIKQYVQTDNAIQEQGVNCIIQKLFETGAGTGNCAGDSGQFNVIQIGTGTGVALSGTAVQTPTTNIATNGIATASGIVVFDSVSGNISLGANATVTVPFSATGTEAIQEAILLNATTGDQAALAYRSFTSIGLEDGDSLTIAWTVEVTESVS